MAISSWTDYRIYLPFYLGIFRWGLFLILRVIPSLFYKQIEPIPATPKNIESGKYQHVSVDDVTVIVTIYEPPEGFLPAMKQVRKNKPKKVYIIADVTCFNLVQKMMDQNNFDREVFTVVCEHKPGKRAALITGIKLSKTKLTLLMDDDSYWTDTFLQEVVLPFQYKDIGGVGVKQVAQMKSYWNMTDILADMRLAVRYLELRSTTTVDRGCSCISGRTGCYLTSLINNEECLAEFANEKFFGMQTLSGDDKFMTRWVVNQGYKTYHQLYNSCSLSTTFDSGSKLIKQLFRWSRNTWRSDIKNLFVERKIWSRCPFTAICMLDKFFTPFFLLFGPFYMMVLFYIRGFNYYELVGYLAWLLVSRGVRLCYHFVEKPHHLVYLPVFVVFQYVQGFIRVWAVLTLHDYNWGTRAVTVNKNGECVRTGVEVTAAQNATLLEKKEDSDAFIPIDEDEYELRRTSNRKSTILLSQDSDSFDSTKGFPEATMIYPEHNGPIPLGQFRTLSTSTVRTEINAFAVSNKRHSLPRLPFLSPYAPKRRSFASDVGIKVVQVVSARTPSECAVIEEEETYAECFNLDDLYNDFNQDGEYSSEMRLETSPCVR